MDEVLHVCCGPRSVGVGARFHPRPCSKSRRIPLKLSDTGRAGLLTLNDTVLKLFDRCSTSKARAAAYRGRKRSLSDSEIVDVRHRIRRGETKAFVAREYGISRETLYQYLRTES
jgi:hypothetical protein